MSETRIRDRAVIIDQGFGVVQRWGIRLVVIAAAFYVLGWAVGHTWVIWFPVALAILFATVLGPPAKALRDRGVPAAAAAGLVLLAFLAALGFLFSILIPQLIDEAPQIADRAAKGVGEVQDWLLNGPLPVESNQISNALDSIEDWLRNSAGDIGSGVLSTIGVATNVVVNTVLVLILTFLFIKDGHRFLPFVERLGGHRVGGHLRELLYRAWNTLGGFIRTQALVSLIDAVLIGGALLIVGQPLWVPLALITFIGGFIPIVGAFASGAIAVLVTLVTNSPQDALIILAVIVAVQQLEGNVLSPMLQGKSMNLHPAIVLMAVTAGGSMFGITGAFLAVPVTATVAEILRYANERIDAALTAGGDPVALTSTTPSADPADDPEAGTGRQV
ncbi:AI-2E family transporter [Aeromicrobium duanguangcaii]|uniref:AI-2E family transporter n=1 Tax=Aeromicrobium duanguangcaii TaxID=2968086 RepID=A0ABY5KCV1_9ACTN|nr:AI-2E family transporter [Aeromicrobium duanguangcaii]MCD9155199.1 AI-2E family transporter [Aeromicrobium duanguangcaii]MCL3838550.1 AI-2E family transporter [Aeromicrobium duanguangcaii]UUI68150.1 AI-2E family transporter [Aeromicrobium duanguangcaii]